MNTSAQRLSCCLAVGLIVTNRTDTEQRQLIVQLGQGM
jgi:hypothetical protein